jgi:dTDP-4-dehydrorhamnose reductase
MKKILLLGSTGKMGTAISKVFTDYEIIGKNSKDFDASDFGSVRDLINDNPADIVINTVAMLGIDSCEIHIDEAIKINAQYPLLLAELSNEKEFILVHFSTDAVFSGKGEKFYTETDGISPVNIYGVTKSWGDFLIEEKAKRYYIFRLPILFGPTTKPNQFVEKMLAKEGTIKVANDIVSSPTYSIDIARRIHEILNHKYCSEISCEYGLYHIANEGQVSLYELMKEIAPNKSIESCSYKDFSYVGKKNVFTPLKSIKLPPLRNWKEAVRECYGEPFDYR